MKSLSEVHSWDTFIQLFERLFHTEWCDTSRRLACIGEGTFFEPEKLPESALWETRHKLLEAFTEIKPAICLAVIEARKVEEDLKRRHVWLTGEVMDNPKWLMFRILEEVYGNPKGAVCLLGARRGLENYFIPLFLRAAERKVELRVYGVFIPTPFPHNEAVPSVTFIVSKAHHPTEPDALPDDQKIIIQPGDRIAGYTVRTISRTESLVEQVLGEFEMLQSHPRSCVI